jgi:hypothetical protein
LLTAIGHWSRARCPRTAQDLLEAAS